MAFILTGAFLFLVYASCLVFYRQAWLDMPLFDPDSKNAAVGVNAYTRSGNAPVQRQCVQKAAERRPGDIGDLECRSSP